MWLSQTRCLYNINQFNTATYFCDCLKPGVYVTLTSLIPPHIVVTVSNQDLDYNINQFNSATYFCDCLKPGVYITLTSLIPPHIVVTVSSQDLDYNINQFNSATYFCDCLKPGPRFPTSYVLVFLRFFYVFVDFFGIGDHHCWNFLFIIWQFTFVECPASSIFFILSNVLYFYTFLMYDNQEFDLFV